LIVVARITEPERYDNRAWPRTTARIRGDSMSVSETWYLRPTVNARHATSRYLDGSAD
jgi:hypothetical protein